MPSRREHIIHAYSLAKELGIKIDDSVLYTIENVIDNPARLSKQLRKHLAECIGLPWTVILRRGQAFRHDWGLVRDRAQNGSLGLLRKVASCLGRDDHSILVDLHVALDYASMRGCEGLAEWAARNGIDPRVIDYVVRGYCRDSRDG